MGTRTRTVMFTDLADYTAAVSRSDREGIRRLLLAHEEIVRPSVDRFGGRVVKNLGDSFMCLFDAATDALRCALDILDVVERGQGGMRIRIGMTTGDVEEIEGDAFGDAVNQAARILGKANAGEAWFGPGTRLCMNAAEIPWEPVGRLSLKGIPGEVEVCRAVPLHACHLPEALVAALKRRRLVRVLRGQEVPSRLPREAQVLLEGFLPGSVALQEALAGLPVNLEPASIHLASYHLSPADRHAWVGSGRGLIIATPEALEQAILEASRNQRSRTGSDTLVLDLEAAPAAHLALAGLALPAVPLSDVVAAYGYDLHPDGGWCNEADAAILSVEVNPSGAWLRARAPGITLDGRTLPMDERRPLTDGARISARGVVMTYRALVDGYVGVLLGGVGRVAPVHEGDTVEMGREPAAQGLPFPERRGAANVRWCPGSRASRARAGGFTLDRALAGRRQAAVTANSQGLILTPLHERCPTYLLRGSGDRLERLTESEPVRVGDHVVVGTTVVAIRSADEG